MAYWAVAHTRGLCEHLVQRRLQRQGFEVWFPRVEVERRRHDGTIRCVEPLFCCYLFVRVELQWHDIRDTDGVTRIVLNGNTPARLDDTIVDALKVRAGPDGLIHLPRPQEDRLRPGDPIRVRGGPLAGRPGIFAGMCSRERVAILLAMLGGTQHVELPGSAAER
jgi:transcriptional antiterminator RfaH